MKILFLLLFFITSVFATPGPPEPTQSAVGPPGPVLPIGNHIIILLIVGLIYGFYVLYNRRKESTI